MFSPIDSEASTIVPVVYLYNQIFGSKGSYTRDAGAGAAVGVLLALIILLVYFGVNKVIKDDAGKFIRVDFWFFYILLAFFTLVLYYSKLYVDDIKISK